MEEKLFGISPSGPYDKSVLKKFNYMTLYLRYYINTCKMQNKAIHLPIEFFFLTINYWDPSK